MRRMKRTTGLFAGLAVVAVMALATTAQAATVKQIITGLVNNAGGSDIQLKLHDFDWSLVFKTNGDLKTSGDLVPGDYFVGTIRLDQAEVVGDPQVGLGGGVNQGLVGMYALKVDTITPSTSITTTWLDDSELTELAAITGVSVSDLQSYGFGSGGNAMVAWFLDGDASGASTGTDTIFNANINAFDYSAVTDGDLWASFGNGSYTLAPVNGNAIFNVGDAAAASGQIATVAINVEVVNNNTDYLLFNSNLRHDNLSASALFGGNPTESNDPNDYGPVTSDISFRANVTIVPEPAAAWMGFAMLGLLSAGRIMRRQHA